MITPPPPTADLNDEAKINGSYLWAVCVAAALGGLLFGYDWVVIGGAAKFYEAFFHLKDTGAGVFSAVGWAQSCALLGCLVGAAISGTLSDRWGRRSVLIFAAANFVVSSLGIAEVSGFSAFVIWRILGGVSIGLASNISPMYISEIAPARRRGLLVAINQLTIVTGVLAAQVVNWWIARPVPAAITPEALALTWNATAGWRWMFAACAAPSLLFFIASIFLPESPRWLAKAGQLKKAEAVFARIGGARYAGSAMADLASSAAPDHHPVRFSELLGRNRRALLVLGITLSVFQQWCGINVIFNYAGEIFRQAGYDLNSTLTNIMMTGVVNLVFTFVALLTVDRLGRKPLMMFGAAALTLIYLLLGYCYHLRAAGTAVPNVLFLTLVLAAIAAYSMSLAPVTWVLISEIFPNRIRGRAMSVSVGSLWIACFLLTYTFPLINARLGASGTFWIYAGICALGLVFVGLRLTETKGRSLEQIERDSIFPAP